MHTWIIKLNKDYPKWKFDYMSGFLIEGKYYYRILAKYKIKPSITTYAFGKNFKKAIKYMHERMSKLIVDDIAKLGKGQHYWSLKGKWQYD